MVLGLLLTTDLSYPTNLFNNVLLPTFVLPNKPIEKLSFSKINSFTLYLLNESSKLVIPNLCSHET